MSQQEIISPVPVEALKAELTDDRLLRHTNKGGNLIYVVDGRECPNVMREIGRLRELTFRQAGGGTGNACDIDDFDLMDPPCRQLIVWEPETEAILGGYRFICSSDIRVDKSGRPRLAMAHIFNFSERFVREIIPHSIELGRSFVRPEYQSSKAGAKALYALDNLWDGLGALTVLHPEVKYLFGKVTMYPTYNRECRDMLLFFMRKHFPDRDNLVKPVNPICQDANNDALARLFCNDDFKADYKVLNAEIHRCGFNIPPLVNAYMSLSPSMRMFGTAVNDEFGNVEESGIMLTISDIYEVKKSRHIATYHPEEEHGHSKAGV